MNRMQCDVAEFNSAIDTPRGYTPEMRAAELRARLIIEEAVETVCGMIGHSAAVDVIESALEHAWKTDWSNPDIVEAVDGLCDLIYVTLGAFDAFGIDAEPFFALVHEANMTKLTGPKDEHGKQGKPPGFVPPQEKIRALLLKLGANL